MSRSMQHHSFSAANSKYLDERVLGGGARNCCIPLNASRITALNVEFVAKPSEAHKVQAALPQAINGTLGGVSGFSGSLVMIANHETRLVTVLTLWTGADRIQRCDENVRSVRALLAPYLDRCLRVQTLDAYVPVESQAPRQFEELPSEEDVEIPQNETTAAVYAA